MSNLFCTKGPNFGKTLPYRGTWACKIRLVQMMRKLSMPLLLDADSLVWRSNYVHRLCTSLMRFYLNYFPVLLVNSLPRVSEAFRGGNILFQLNYFLFLLCSIFILIFVEQTLKFITQLLHSSTSGAIWTLSLTLRKALINFKVTIMSL